MSSLKVKSESMLEVVKSNQFEISFVLLIAGIYITLGLEYHDSGYLGNYADAIYLSDNVPKDGGNVTFNGSIKDRQQSVSHNIINKSVADYTVFIYIIASDLESKSAIVSQDIIEMQKAYVSPNINVILQTGGSKLKPESLSGNFRSIDFSKTLRSQVANGKIATLMDLGNLNMAENKSLSDFMTWGIKKFPAKKYAIFFWDHGSGVTGFGKDLNYNDTLSPGELKSAFETTKTMTNQTFELIGFDACLMASLEILNNIFPYGNFAAFSQEIVPSWGWNYTAVLDSIKSDNKMDGPSLGKVIVDSYAKSSEAFSKERGIHADRKITASVIDLHVVPELVDRTIKVANSMSYYIDKPENLTRAIDLTEKYGLGTRGGSGLVDLYDLTFNLKNEFPDLSRKVEDLHQSIVKAVIYDKRGNAKPNAHGISIYMPLQKSEFLPFEKLSDDSLFSITKWSKLLSGFSGIRTFDIRPPGIESVLRNDTLLMRIQENDFSYINSMIAINSTYGHRLIYQQSIDRSSINNQQTYVKSMNQNLTDFSDVLFPYSKHEIFTLCDGQKCIPASMKLEISRDKKFVLVPVRVESDSDNINQNVSLIYESYNGGYQFLGVTPEVNPLETVPKIELDLKPGYKIYTKAINQTLRSIGSTAFQNNSMTSNFSDEGPLTFSSPDAFLPKYAPLMYPFSIRFTFCDFSDNCSQSRWYTLDHSVSNKVSQSRSDSGENYNNLADAELCGNSSITSNTCNYVNRNFGFSFQYPSHWVLQSQDICNITNWSYDFLSDPYVVTLYPGEYETASYNVLRYYPYISIAVQDPPLMSTKASFEDFKTLRTQKNLTQQVGQLKSHPINGHPSFEFVTKFSLQPGFEKLDEKTEKRVSILMGSKYYLVKLSSYSKDLNKYLPVFEKVVNSLQVDNGESLALANISDIKNYTSNKPCDRDNATKWGEILRFHEKRGESGVDIFKNETFRNEIAPILLGPINYTTLYDKVHHYKIDYPSFAFIQSLKQIPNQYIIYYGNSAGEFISVGSFFRNETQGPIETIFKIPVPFSLQTLKPILEKKHEMLEEILFDHWAYDTEYGMESINGKQALTEEYHYFEPTVNSRLTAKIVYMIDGDNLFVFHFNSHDFSFWQNSYMFDKMLNSFEIEK